MPERLTLWEHCVEPSQTAEVPLVGGMRKMRQTAVVVATAAAAAAAVAAVMLLLWQQRAWIRWADAGAWLEVESSGWCTCRQC